MKAEVPPNLWYLSVYMSSQSGMDHFRELSNEPVCPIVRFSWWLLR